MRWVVRAEATSLETEIPIGRLGGRHRPGKLRNGNGVFLVANIDHPVWEIDPVAVGICGFTVRQNETAVEYPAINGMECDAHSRVLRRRLKSSNLLLMHRVGQIENDKAVAAERSVAAVASVL